VTALLTSSLVRPSPDFTPECGPAEEAYTDVNDLIACYNYLNSLGQTPCSIGNENSVTTFVSSGTGKATGQSINEDSQSSFW
jgi:hypothetical protein